MNYFKHWERLEGHAATLAQAGASAQDQADAQSAADVAYAAWELVNAAENGVSAPEMIMPVIATTTGGAHDWFE